MKSAKSAGVLRKQAAAILSANGVTRPPVPVESIARSLGAIVKYLPFEGQLAGMLVRKDGKNIIGVNSLHHPNRQRFTIAHECGHLLLHKEAVHIDRGFYRNEVSSQAVDNKEIESNRFAAELLMPYSMITADLAELNIDMDDEDSIRQLAKLYQVSTQAMTLRINNLMPF